MIYVSEYVFDAWANELIKRKLNNCKIITSLVLPVKFLSDGSKTDFYIFDLDKNTCNPTLKASSLSFKDLSEELNIGIPSPSSPLSSQLHPNAKIRSFYGLEGTYEVKTNSYGSEYWDSQNICFQSPMVGIFNSLSQGNIIPSPDKFLYKATTIDPNSNGQRHKCTCPLDVVINQGCKCGGC